MEFIKIIPACGGPPGGKGETTKNQTERDLVGGGASLKKPRNKLASSKVTRSKGSLRGEGQKTALRSGSHPVITVLKRWFRSVHRKGGRSSGLS